MTDWLNRSNNGTSFKKDDTPNASHNNVSSKDGNPVLADANNVSNGDNTEKAPGDAKIAPTEKVDASNSGHLANEEEADLSHKNDIEMGQKTKETSSTQQIVSDMDVDIKKLGVKRKTHDDDVSKSRADKHSKLSKKNSGAIVTDTKEDVIILPAVVKSTQQIKELLSDGDLPSDSSSTWADATDILQPVTEKTILTLTYRDKPIQRSQSDSYDSETDLESVNKG